ncbi:hypothetical protein SJI19_16970 [Acerihabitans sp. TG2]|uniref:hypothetical protein n=1 Tax=Acerihabitans sp. TG2 TaxID=3096008 RepID=UPI002B23D777|nr:hypothetical protein [Acerihabitans sp. TG2]MEA9392219.1 hypothetical protein [Acerihabitans sp. TG2]
MKLSIPSLNNFLNKTILSSSIFIYSTASKAIDKMDLTSDASGGKSFSDFADRQDQNIGIGATLVCLIFALFGLLLVGWALNRFHKAGKSEGRESAVPGVIALLCGGALFVVSTIAGLVKNSII